MAEVLSWVALARAQGRPLGERARRAPHLLFCQLRRSVFHFWLLNFECGAAFPPFFRLLKTNEGGEGKIEGAAFSSQLSF